MATMPSTIKVPVADAFGERAYRFPAKVITARATQSAEELLGIATQHAENPDRLREANPFFFRAEISSDRVDSYFTKMMPSTLRNYATHAQEGRSILLSHDSRSMPVGRSIMGEIEQAGDATRVVATGYIVPGISGDKMPSSDVILGIQTGIYRDVSVGFYGGRCVCNVCGGDMFDWGTDCTHWPGDTVKRDGQDLLVLGLIEGANLAEYSLVYEGATPGAMVERALRMMEAGKLDNPGAERLEQRYRSAMPRRRVSYVGVSIGRQAGSDEPSPNPEPSADNSNNEVAMETELTAQLEAGTVTEPETPEQPAAADAADAEADVVRALLAEAGAPEGATLRWFVDQIAELRPLAETGRQYRADLIAETLAEGVRAMTGFRREVWEPALKVLALDEIRAIRDGWRSAAAERFPAGRITEEPRSAEPKAGKANVPDEAFKIGR